MDSNNGRNSDLFVLVFRRLLCVQWGVLQAGPVMEWRVQKDVYLWRQLSGILQLQTEVISITVHVRDIAFCEIP